MTKSTIIKDLREIIDKELKDCDYEYVDVDNLAEQITEYIIDKILLRDYK